MRALLAALILLLVSTQVEAQVRTIATDAASGTALKIVSVTDKPLVVTGKGFAPITVSPGLAFGTFKAATRTTAGTTLITDPDPGGSIVVTWVMLSGEKQANSDVTIRFTDGTNNVDIIVVSQVDAPPNLAIGFPSKVQGWQDARIDMITSGAGDATASIGYFKVPTSIPFTEWDALR